MQQPFAGDEATVIVRMAAGDRAALAELYARHERALLAYLRLLTGDAGLAEELLQDTLLAAWTGAHAFAGRASVQGWLFGIARRRAHDTLRRRHLRLVDSTALETASSSEPNPEDLLLAEADRAEVTAAIARLGAIHQEILVLTFIHELSYLDLAEVLGIPLGTVKSRLNHAKRALREQLRPEGIRR
ncbi:MAG: sigma-70 family RNA polymerase sigma factor [Thermomicrobiales bacterium]